MRKLLFIQYRPFGTVMNGGDQGTKKNLEMLGRVLGDENIEVYYLHDKAGKSSVMEYAKGASLMPFGYFLGLTPAKVKDIARKAQGFDYVFIDRSLFGVVAKGLKEAGYKGRIITSFQNTEVAYMEAKMPKRLPFRGVVIRCADRNDRWSCRCSDKVIVLNERDKISLQRLYGRTAESMIPVAMKDKCKGQKNDKKAMTSPKLRCLFLGAYFLANTEGIIWFMRNVYPQVDVEVKIVGRGMGKLKEEQPDLLRDIEVVNDAPDLEPYLEWADVMVLPIFAGSGMKVKTCESLMYGKNIIATDEALEGYAIEEGVSAWRCNTVDEFVQTIQDFAKHPRPRFNQAARQCFMENYSNEAVENKFKELLS